MRSARSRRQRVQMVARWRASEESLAAFARREGIHPRTFWGWVHAGPSAAPRASAIAPHFVPLQIAAEPVDPTTGPPPVDILLPRGTVVRVTPGTSPTWLAAVVTALSAAC